MDDAISVSLHKWTTFVTLLHLTLLLQKWPRYFEWLHNLSQFSCHYSHSTKLICYEALALVTYSQARDHFQNFFSFFSIFLYTFFLFVCFACCGTAKLIPYDVHIGSMKAGVISIKPRTSSYSFYFNSFLYVFMNYFNKAKIRAGKSVKQKTKTGL